MPKKVAKTEKTEKPEPTPVIETVPVPAPVSVPVTIPDVKEDDMSNAYSDVNTKLASMRQQLSSLIVEFKALQKRAERELKAVQKAGNKRKQRNATRAPSGFVKPTLISDQLAEFLGKEKGSLIARTEVTREINAYIRANQLQDPANGRKINPDAKLKKLLTLNATDELTYFNLQRYMSQHFQKMVKAV